MPSINLNQTVYVRLTEAGRRAVREWDERVGLESSAWYRIFGTEDGRSTFMLWELMEMLGPSMRHGMEHPFEGGIIEYDEPTSLE